jgi:hypothetical protein
MFVQKIITLDPPYLKRRIDPLPVKRGGGSVYYKGVIQ